MELVTENKVLEFVADFQKPAVVSKVRQQALDALSGMDFPHRKVEEWKYTRVVKYGNRKYQQKTADVNADNYTIEGLNAHRLVFVNGYFDEKQSTIFENDGLTIQTIEEVDESLYSEILEDVEENVFSVINKAFQTGGVYVHVAKNVKVEHPIHIIHILKGTETIQNVRHFVHVEQGSKAEMVVTFNSEDSENSFSNLVFEGLVEENASFTIHKIQAENKDVLHISRELFIQEESSTFTINTITTGGELTRNQLDILVAGKNCSTYLNGAYLGVGKQHIDNHTFVDQIESNCMTDELYKGVMDDNSTGVFNGMILVRPDSQKIEAYQSNKNVLLSRKAKVYSKPELEIYADDVRCSHGSTIGDLDESAIFYLRQRGIEKDKAQQLLIAAFIGDVLDRIENEVIRKEINKHLFEDFGWEF